MQTSNKYVHQLTPQEDSNHNDIDNLEIDQGSQDSINVENDRYPYCIVWTSIPLISWLIPCIGHTGICTSEGTIHDFSGPYSIGVDQFSFGRPQKYLQLNQDHKVSREQWDNAVLNADEKYKLLMHNLFTNNCHSHCAKALNIMSYQSKHGYTMFHIWLMLILNAKYVSKGKFFQIFLPFIIIYGIIILVSTLTTR